MATKKIAKKRAAAKKATGLTQDKIGRDELAEMVQEKVSDIHAAADDHWENIPGVTVHAVLYAVDPAVASGPCNPPCGPGQQCMLRSSGGTVEWVCV